MQSEESGSRRVPLLRELEIKAVDDCLSMIKALDERIQEVSVELKQKASGNEKAKLLMTIPGVGYFSALAILAEISDISRFDNAEKLCSYAGLIPSIHQSGAMRRYGRITKQGSGLLRWVLLECVWTHIQYNTWLTRFFYRIAKRKGKKVAVVAAARKPADNDILDAKKSRRVSRLGGRGTS